MTKLSDNTKLYKFLCKYPNPCEDWANRMKMTIGDLTPKQKAQGGYHYARHVIKGRWEQAEEYIMTDAQWAYLYAVGVIEGRWELAEKYIKTEREYSRLYDDFIFSKTGYRT